MKIGDKVQFGADAEGRPIWDFNEHRDEFDHFNTGKVIDVNTDAGEIEVEYEHTDGSEAIWVWPMKAPRDADEHWLRPATERPALVSADSKPVWVETVKCRRKAEIPEIIISQMLDRGERGVRRSLRDIFAELEKDHPFLKENLLTAMGNIRDVIAYPRTPGHA